MDLATKIRRKLLAGKLSVAQIASELNVTTSRVQHERAAMQLEGIVLEKATARTVKEAKRQYDTHTSAQPQPAKPATNKKKRSPETEVGKYRQTQSGNFYESVMLVTGCTQQEAEKVLEVYLKLKIAKITAHDGIQLKHGAFWDKAVLLNAIKY